MNNNQLLVLARADAYYDQDLRLLANVLRWCWNDKAEMVFSDEAIGELLNAATSLHEIFFSESIPLVGTDRSIINVFTRNPKTIDENQVLLLLNELKAIC